MQEEHIIKPVNKFSLNFPELWKYRELIYFFTWRDIKVKYKQTYLGVAWVVLQPLFMMLVYTVLFNKILNADSHGVPYPIFVYSGLLLWGLFSSSLSSTGDSMVSNAGIIKKIYFPRLIIPLSSTFTCIFDFCISLIIYAILLISFKIKIDFVLFIFNFPLAFIITLFTSLGLGTLLSALNVKYRDFRYILPFLIQALFFFTPIVYSGMDAQSKFEYYTWIKFLNPIASAIDLIRAPLTGHEIGFAQILTSLAVSFMIFTLGIVVFRKTEAYFADLA